MKVVINVKHGGFGLSHAAYVWLITQGVPALPWRKQERDPETGLWIPMPDEKSPIIRFDRPEDTNTLSEALTRLTGTDYRCHWYDDHRDDPLLVACVEMLGDKANGRCAKLKVVEIPRRRELHDRGIRRIRTCGGSPQDMELI